MKAGRFALYGCSELSEDLCCLLACINFMNLSTARCENGQKK